MEPGSGPPNDRQGSDLARELTAEQAHVDRVYERLEQATRAAQQVAAEGRALFTSDHGTVVREEDGTGLYERDVFAFQAAKRLATLDAEHEGLVFGRLDRRDREIRYVGRIGVRDADYEPLVIDWRAPAAEPFYRATPAAPLDVVRRRVLRCRGDRVVGIEDDLLDVEAAPDDLVVLGEGALMASLTRARGHTMRDIVATIQAEQDEAIRAPWSGATMITGGPGTGKTVVALHRAAYLLYSNRRRFESGGVLVVGPSQLYMTYIERVLPSLGEESVTLRPVGAVAVDVTGVRAERQDSPAAAAVKGSLRMVPLLRRLVAEPLTAQPPELRVTVHGEVLVLRAPELMRIRRDVLAHTKLNAARTAAERALLSALWRAKPEDLEIDQDAFDELVRESAAFRMFCLAWWPTITATTALARLADPALTRRLADSLLRGAEADVLSGSYRTSPPWTVADAALLDELAALLGPVPEPDGAEGEDEVGLFLRTDSQLSEVVTTMDRLQGPREVDPLAEPNDTFAHVLVDEAQDVSPMQWRMLRRRGPNASWTIVGDPAQSAWPDPEEADRAMREATGTGASSRERGGTSRVRQFRMSTNYRSPAEVFDLASAVVVEAYPDADLPTAVRHTGVHPDLRVGGADFDADVLRAVDDLLAAVEGTVGVVCPPSALAAVSRILADRSERLVVVSPLQAKGLEYDGVLVVAPDDLVAESPGGVRTLYVALTRPTQRLVTLDAAPGAVWRKSLGSRATGSS